MKVHWACVHHRL